MDIGIPSRWKGKGGKLTHGGQRTATGVISYTRPRTLRQGLRHFLGVNEEGSQLVEMAIVFPILLVILTGMASFGMALYSQQQLGLATAGAVQGVATGASVTSSTDPCATAETYVTQQLPGWTAASFSYTLKMYTSSTTSVTATGTGTSFSCSSDSGDLTINEPVVLTVAYPYGWFAIFQWSKYGSTFKPSGNLTVTEAAMAQ
jgi:Flp pilus assembly protein TadG